MDIFIRSATLEDVEEMAKIFVACVRTLNIKDYTDEQIEIMATFCDAQSYMEEIAMGGNVLVAEAKSIVGFASLAKNGERIDDVFVRPDYTRQGIGTVLLATLERVALQKQSSQLLVMASLTARPFYLSCGFKYVRDTKIVDAATGVEIPGIEMIKALQSNNIYNIRNITLKSFGKLSRSQR